MTIAADLPFGPEAPSQARRFLLERAPHLSVAQRQDAELLISEIVTNAVRYGGPTITLAVDVVPPEITVSVTDHGEGVPQLADAAPDPHAASGRGMLIVDAVPDRWGVTSGPDGAGKTVWFSLLPRSE